MRFDHAADLHLPSAPVHGARESGSDERPDRIANITGQVAQNGFDNLIWLTAVLSFSIGLVNLFPIPVLDGGHLTFYLLEAIRRKPLGERRKSWLPYRLWPDHGAAVVVSFNDVRKLIDILVG